MRQTDMKDSEIRRNHDRGEHRPLKAGGHYRVMGTHQAFNAAQQARPGMDYDYTHKYRVIAFERGPSLKMLMVKLFCTQTHLNQITDD